MKKEELKEYLKKYKILHSKELKEYNKKYNKQYRETHKTEVKAYRELYKLQGRKYATPEYIRNWRRTEKGKESFKRCKARYERNKKWIPILPNIFPEEMPVDYHHIDGNWFVVPIPRNIHERASTKNVHQHLMDANDWVEFYYDLNLTDFLIGELK